MEGGWNPFSTGYFKKEEKTHKEKMLLSCTEDLHLIRANVY